METKTWMTPKRIERGPEAANAELARWRAIRHERPHPRANEKFTNTAAMRADADTSRRAGVGSRVVSASKTAGVDWLDVALVAGMLTGAYAFWRTLKKSSQVSGAGAEESAYYVGAVALGAR